MADPSPLWQRIEGDISRETGLRAQARALPSFVRLLIASAVATGVNVAIYVSWLRHDFAVYPRARFVVESVLLFATILLSIAVALRPMHRPGLRRARGVHLGWSLGLVLVLAALPTAHLAYPGSLGGTGSAFAGAAASCFSLGMLWAVPPIIAVWVLNRSVHLNLATFVAGGLVGNLGLLAHCPIVWHGHRFAGHATVLLVLVGLALTLVAVRRRV